MNGPTSRRDFLAAGAGLLVRAAAPMQVARAPQTLLKGGAVLSLDPAIGNVTVADVLIEGTKIAAIRPSITAAGATVIDASNTIVMPGFVDTHRHCWQGALRNTIPNGLLGDYVRDILGARAFFRPEDVHIGNLVTALGAINAGVTTLLDWSHIGNTPEHTDAAIEGLRESGVRAVYAYGSGTGGARNQYPEDIRRLRSRFFSSEDQLLTLALAAGTNASEWAVARQVGAPITLHLQTTDQLRAVAGAMRSDVTYIHCNQVTDIGWKMIADSGGHVSIACPIEMEMGHGVPPIQQAIDHGIRPSLSVDVETQMPGDFFTQMRSVFTLQRMLALNRPAGAAGKAPALLTAREVIEFATIEGAKDNRLDRKIGTLTPGKDADVILLRTDAINVMPVNNAFGAIVLGMDTSNVDTVLIGGRVMKRGGRLVGVDLTRIARAAQQSRDAIVAKAGWPRNLFGDR